LVHSKLCSSLQQVKVEARIKLALELSGAPAGSLLQVKLQLVARYALRIQPCSGMKEQLRWCLELLVDAEEACLSFLGQR
jgi:hypothetical protein